MESLSWLLSQLLEPFQAFLSISDRLGIIYLSSSLAIAYIVFVVTVGRNGGAANPFHNSPKLFLHRSAVLDYWYVWINRLVFPFLYAPIFYASTFLSDSVLHMLTGDDPRTLASATTQSTLSIIVFSLVVIAAYDLGIYLAHLASHRIPILWEFHKVHHSAEVLTPVTVYRMHPVDDSWTLLIANIFSGTTAGVVRWLIPGSGVLFTVGDINIFLFLFYFLGFHLRHSHVWFSYGPYLSKIFISPAQHQIHHSTNSKHYDRNFGFIFALWDWIFGSLYIPREKENLVFGLPVEDSSRLDSVPRLYIQPFVGMLKILGKRSK